MTPDLEKIELQCRKLLVAKTSEQRSEVFADSVGYLGLAQAYIAMCDLYNKERLYNFECNNYIKGE